MKYVFFDIECANGGIGSICSFGYVITDEDFNVIIQRDIIINPPGKFKLTGRERKADIVLAYPEYVFRQHPKFYYYYNEIEGVLTSDNVIIVGHSTENDAIFLNKSCERYKKPFIDFKYFDTQKLFSKLNNEKKQISLENSLIAYGLEVPSGLHRSDIDAHATMELAKEMCKKEGVTLSELVKIHIDCTGENKDGIALYHGETLESRQAKKDRKARSSKAQEEDCENRIRKGRKNYLLFTRFMEQYIPDQNAEKILEGKKICITKNYELENFKEMIHIVKKIKDAGGEYTVKASLSDVFATDECFDKEGNKRECSRLNYVLASDRVNEIAIQTLDDFLSTLNTSKEQIASLPPIDLSYLVSEPFEKISV